MIPAFLKPNDKVYLVAPSGKIESEKVQFALHLLQNEWHLKPILGAGVGKNHFRFAATDSLRLADLQMALNDLEAKAIFCLRGGYGVSRIIEDLDFTLFAKNPKWLIGFSDITFLHLKIATLKISSLHAIMPSQWQWEGIENSLENLKQVLFKNFNFAQKYEVLGQYSPLQSEGKVQGLTLGGNLAVLQHSLGTGYEPDFEGKILFLEDIGENLYRIDRMLVQFESAGILSKIAGLVVGNFTGSTETEEDFGENITQIFHRHWKKYAAHKPLGFGFPIGHTAENYAIFHHAPALLTVDKEGARLCFELENQQNKSSFF
ncbi:S66 peptidase family protein [Hugenholtzia roseola]|uniref:S66 peptidase family protein n=1 Tax=Hugenholtzia roseola TaxID=1002 RepID=UPI000410E8F9|nr:LD-carboxypeptidase [Hugenholtzia roseola]